MELIRGKLPKAKKVVCYGPEGIGKSTFASQFPSPVFIDVEGSTHELDVARVPTCSSWTMLLEQVRYFIAHPAELKTLVVDTADWAERMCVTHICAAHDQKGVESFGYGRGYIYVYEEFGRFLNLLSELVDKAVNVVILAHATLRKFEQPDEMGSYDRYELKLTKKTGAEISAMLKEWCDMLLFATYKTIVVNVDGQGATKGKNKAQGGRRVMYTTHTPSWDAKNRYGLPDELPFDYRAIASVIEGDATQEQLHKAPLVDELVQSPPIHAPAAAELLTDDEALQAMSEACAAAAQLPEEVPSDLPKALFDLMKQDGITEPEIMYAVTCKGYYPEGTPIRNYEPGFVHGVLIGAWPQVRAMITSNRENTPF